MLGRFARACCVGMHTMSAHINTSSVVQESTKHRKMLYQFEKQREKYGSEASSANAKFVAALEEVGRRQLNECFTFSVFRATAFAAGQAS